MFEYMSFKKFFLRYASVSGLCSVTVTGQWSRFQLHLKWPTTGLTLLPTSLNTYKVVWCWNSISFICEIFEFLLIKFDIVYTIAISFYLSLVCCVLLWNSKMLLLYKLIIKTNKRKIETNIVSHHILFALINLFNI